MTDTIDWNAPLEAYHPDGRVVEVTCKPAALRDDWFAISGLPDTGWDVFMPDGRHNGGNTPWTIRNRSKPTEQTQAPSPELVERITRTLGSVVDEGGIMASEANAILTELGADPLERCLEAAGYAVFPDDLHRLRAELAKRGLAIVELAKEQK